MKPVLFSVCAAVALSVSACGGVIPTAPSAARPGTETVSIASPAAPINLVPPVVDVPAVNVPPDPPSVAPPALLAPPDQAPEPPGFIGPPVVPPVHPPAFIGPPVVDPHNHGS